MIPLFVVDEPRRNGASHLGGEVVGARSYLSDAEVGAGRRGVAVCNLCRSYRYQSQGYYVSLLAEARGHRPIPDIATIQRIRDGGARRQLESECGELIAQALRPLKTDAFELSVWFGCNLAKRYDRLCRAIFQLFQAPLLRVAFQRQRGQWRVQQLRLLGLDDVPEQHRALQQAAAQRFFSGRRRARRAPGYRYDLAILTDPQEAEPPSCRQALARFAHAARRAGLRPTFIERGDSHRLAIFDALFIRETTRVDHHTFRFAQRAAALGLAVIDDPRSIIRCTNKVFLAELLTRHRVPTPATMIVHRDNAAEVGRRLGLPVVLKQPDSGFSQGVHRADDEETLQRQLQGLFTASDLVIAQAWTPSTFDWRIGLLDREPLFACRYHMAAGHWQIIRHDQRGRVVDLGEHETLPLSAVPETVLRAAGRAGKLVGDGFYGVDVKEIDGRALVIEVNDNPNVEAGVEDQLLGEALYDRVIGSLLRRIDQLRHGGDA